MTFLPYHLYRGERGSPGDDVGRLFRGILVKEGNVFLPFLKTRPEKHENFDCWPKGFTLSLTAWPQVIPAL